MFFSHFMLFPTFLEQQIWEYKTIISQMFSSCFFLYAGNIEKYPFTQNKNWCKKKSGGGGVLNFFLEKQFFLISRFMLFSTLKNIEIPPVCPSVRPSRLVYWLNGRWFLQIPVVDRDSWNLYSLYPLFPCSDFVSQMWGWFGGGGGVMFFSHFMLFPTFLEQQIWEYKTIISQMFSSCFFLYAGNIEKYPFTYSYWLNGRWFLQIVDIGNFIMRLEILKSAPSLTG